jgi:hypothetical protein
MDLLLLNKRYHTIFLDMIFASLLQIVQQRTSQESHRILKFSEAVGVKVGEPNLEFFYFLLWN